MTKQKLKIAIFHLAFIYSGGGEKLVLQEYDGLKKRGHSVSIFTTAIDIKKSFPDIIKKYKIKTFLPNLKVFEGHWAFQTILTCILAPFFAYKFRNYDVILACNQPSAWIAFIVKKLFGVPYVSYIAQPTRFLHPRAIDKKTGLFFEKNASESLSARAMMTTFRGFSNWADRISIRNSNEILVNGGYIRSVINKTYKVNAINCPSGVKTTKRINTNKGDYLLVTNRHFPQKRLEYAIFALNSILQIIPKCRLVVTGSYTEYTQKLKNLVVELGLEKNVEFVGYIEERRLNSLYKKAICYLYTAPEEDFGMGIVEAMGNGCPVIAWDASGPSKIITNGKDGLLATPYELPDFIKKIESIVLNKKKANQITKDGIQTVMKSFSLKKHVDTVENYLNNVFLNTK